MERLPPRPEAGLVAGPVAGLRGAAAVLLLAAPLLLGWHPEPTLGTLAEALAVFCIALVLLSASAPLVQPGRALLWGAGGILGLLMLRCLAQAVFGSSAYAGFWLGPLAVLLTAFLICLYWPRGSEDWLRVVAAAVLLAALGNALVGCLQFWRVAAVFDFLGPHWLYWDRTDSVAHGNVAQRNILASLCLLGMVASLYLFPARRGLRLLTLGFLAYVVALTASRTPLVILAGMVLLALVRERHWRALGQPFVSWLVASVALMQVLVPLLHRLLFSVVERLPVASLAERLGTEGLGTRGLYYRLAADIGAQAWAWGLGWKSLPQAMVEQGYRQGLWGLDELPTHAHNLLLQLWVENGLILALLASLYPIWLLLRRGLASAGAHYARWSLLVLVVHSWLEYPLWQPALLFLFVTLLCTLESIGSAPALARVRPRRWLSALTLALVLGAALTVAQLAALADSWAQRHEAAADSVTQRLARWRLNPVTEPYVDWLELNRGSDTPPERLARLERLAHWLPDSMMLGLLAEAYRTLGREAEAQRIEDRRAVVFGIPPGG